MTQTPTARFNSEIQDILDKALAGHPLDAAEGYALMTSEVRDLDAIIVGASQLRRQVLTHPVITYSRKVFIPLTNLCRDRCGYCTFVKAPNQKGAHTMTPDQVRAVALEGATLGCKEALLSLGDHPEWRHPMFLDTLKSFGYDSTPAYVAGMSEMILEETGLLPHTNCGLLNESEMEEISFHNASMGIMLESTSTKLLDKGGPHFGTTSKAPALRLNTLTLAGKLGIAMTTGILIGIGETHFDRVDSLLAIREQHEHYGHIQEVIIQNFRSKPTTKMRSSVEPSTVDMLRTLAVARLLLGPRMAIQAPPNLNMEECQAYLSAGISDWGGVSPLTPDFINPEAPWPSLNHLRTLTKDMGFDLRERLALYPEFVVSNLWTHSKLIAQRIGELADPNGLVKKELEQWQI